MNLTRTQWPLGWIPSADPQNGPRECLLRMDNLQQDETGVLSLVRGLKGVSAPGTLIDYPNDIYSKVINGKEIIWAGLNAAGRTVVRTKTGDFTDAVTVSNGNARATFGDALGQVLIANGTLRKKDDGTTIRDLGLQTPGIPQVSAVSQPTIAFYQGTGPGTSQFVTQRISGTWALEQGHGSSPIGGQDGINVILDLVTNVGQVVLADLPNFKVDSTNIGDGPAVDPSTDTWQFTVTPDDSSVITSVRIDIIVDGNIDKSTNYYTFTFGNDALLPGLGVDSVLSVKRGDFTRVGNSPTNDWTTVTDILITINSTASISCDVKYLAVIGGIAGALNGNYVWFQLNKNDNGTYVAKSPAGPKTQAFTVINGYVTLTPAPVEAQVTDIEFYRLTAGSSPESFLGQPYLVASTKPGVPVQDRTSDTDAIETNIVLNQFLKSVQPLTDGNGLLDTIYGIIGLFKERTIYMGLSFIYLSDNLNPDAVDTRYTLKAFGDPTETNLWIKPITNNVLILGTTKDLYEITGTFTPQPDGTIDVNIIPIGENYPPLSYDAAYTEGAIFYTAADGIRLTAGSNSQLISPQLNLLFQGETRQGIPPVVIVPNNNAKYGIAIGKTRLYVALPNASGDRYLFVYDLINKRWRLQFTDPISVFVTASDHVLLGYNISADANFPGAIFELDNGSGVTASDGTQVEGLPMTFQTIYDHNEQPRNRKDTFTLKIVCDTGGRDAVVSIAKDNGSFVQLQADNSTNGRINGAGTFYFNLSAQNITLGFRYAIKIQDYQLLTSFRLFEVTIEYDPRPEQVDYLRIQPNNLGTISRKRFINYAFVIDTLGNNITFTPLIDNSNTNLLPQSQQFSTQVKGTFIFYFTKETIGTDISGILSGGVFEFYQLNLEEIVSEKLPVPTKYLVIPNNDYGTPDRKRHSSYKFQINTRGANVKFTPKLDGVLQSPITFSTSEKRVIEYFFNSDTIAIEVGGILESVADTPFEFYGVIIPEQVEKLPPRLEYYRIPNTNYGVAGNKRIRTMPMVLDTYGKRVQFQSIVDNLPLDTSTFVTTGKITVLHYFNHDVFGVDYGGQLQSLENPPVPFEFYELLEPENVETLPTPKVYDQIGPVRFDKIGKVFDIRLRIIPLLGLTSIPWFIVGDNDVQIPAYGSQTISGTLIVNPGLDDIYTIQLPKSINLTVMRIVLGPTTQPFCRYDMQVRVSMSGMESDSQWVPVR